MSDNKKIIILKSLVAKLPALRKKGKVIAFTNGCFDIMHMGHVAYLQKAKRDNRILIVGLNSDRSIQRIKGPNRPICPQKSRAAVLAALACVDFVVLFNEETPYNLIKAVKPDILIKGADYKNRVVVGADIAKRVELLPFIKGFSTSDIIKRIAKTHGGA